jgi:hypothetical protein
MRTSSRQLKPDSRQMHQHKTDRLTPDPTTSVALEWLTILLRIRETPASNLGLETGNPDLWFYHSYQMLG